MAFQGLWAVCVVLLLACCSQRAVAADAGSTQPPAAEGPSASAVKREPKNLEEEYTTVPIRSVLGDSPRQPLSTGKVVQQLSDFEIVYEGPGEHTGDLNLTTPLFTASYSVQVNAISGINAEGDSLTVDGPYGMWSLDAEQRFFWMPVEGSKPHVTIFGRADFPRQIVIRGKWGGPSPTVATLGRFATRGAMPRSFPVDIKAPEVCSYTWTTPDSGCNNVFTGKFLSEPTFAIKTNIGGFAYASLYQDALAFNKYAEITCVIDPDSAKIEPCPAMKGVGKKAPGKA